MYDLVADIRQYPVFIPWCEALRVRQENLEDGAGEMIADMVVRYKFFLEKFRSRVELDPDSLSISAFYMDGPFEKLENKWTFIEEGVHSSIVDFSIDFDFKNKILQTLAMDVFDRAFMKMSDAFINRAHVLYGASTPSR